MKIKDFPPPNRGAPPGRDEFKDYLKKYGGKKLKRRFSDFNLLLYIAEQFDPQTAV